MKSVLSIQSHVVFGCAGNSAAVFPMRRLGMDVWPINTVQFSNHTQYAQGWQGMAMPAGHISALVKGLGNIEVLSQCDAVLSGYLGSAAQGDEILTVVNAVKAANPDAIYFCDPVMGHPEKGCIVAPGVTRFLTEQALPVADMMAPNLLELETLCDTHLADLDQTRAAAHQLLARGVKLVLVKHLGRAAQDSSRFEMLLATPQGDYLIARPLYDFARQPVGGGRSYQRPDAGEFAGRSRCGQRVRAHQRLGGCGAAGDLAPAGLRAATHRRARCLRPARG